MQAFEYAAPKTLNEAVALLGSSWGESEVLAGGTDLVSAMKDEVTTPRRVVSLKHITALRRVEFSAKTGLHLGALATIQELLDSKDVQANYPGLIQAADGIRSEQLRHMGTVGGELLQRPRCWYYRNGFGLLAEYKGKSLVPDGKTFKIAGRLEYQACDSKICYIPTSTPVEWQLHVMPLDTQRAPEDIRHK